MELNDFYDELIWMSFWNVEPDSAEVVVEIDDSKEAEVADASDDDDDSDEAKSDLNTDDDSKEGIRPCKLERNFHASRCIFGVYVKLKIILNQMRIDIHVCPN